MKTKSSPSFRASAHASLRTYAWALALALGLPAGLFAADATRFSASGSDRHKVRVTSRTVAGQIQNEGGRLIGDYGAFLDLDVNQAGADELGQTPGVEVHDEDNVIMLNAGAVDTRQADATMSSRKQRLGLFGGKTLHMVQFAGPPKPEWYAELTNAHLRIVTYVPQNAYLVYGDSVALSNLEQMAATRPAIQWQGRYLDADKIHPRAKTVDAAGNPRNIGTDMFQIQLVADADANAATLQLIDGLQTERIRDAYRVRDYVNLVARVAPDRLEQISARPDVVSIQPYWPPGKCDERQDQIVSGNLNSGGSAPTAPGYLAWLAGRGFSQAQFDASGFLVDVVDDGFDNGSASSPANSEFRRFNSPAQTSRVVYAIIAPGATGISSPNGIDGHGNINASIVGGYNDGSGSPANTDSSGYHYGLGVCPFARLGSTKIFRDGGAWGYPNETTMVNNQYSAGCRISSDSWGANTAGQYDTDSQNYDTWTRDAQPSTAGNQEMLFVFAAGNAGSSAGTVGSPGTAKNVITVGAGENVNPIGTDGCGTTDADANNANDVVGFSSRGPCTDGRKKPEILAPGSHIQGAASYASGYNGVGVCNQYSPAGQTKYAESSGTSHSTPSVAGGCALVRQYFINQGWSAPTPAMTKAYLMNSARYMTGVSANDTLWSNNQGMGGMHLGTAFDGTPRLLRDELAADKFTASGQTRTFTGAIADAAKPFRATLAWSDAPGSTIGNAYKNNLDLTVTVGAQTYKGNVFSGAYSTAGGVADVRNNAESVFLPAGVSGAFTVTVTAVSINSDGVPNNADALDQDFALVVCNAANAPILVADGAALVSESYAPTNGYIDPGETVTVNLALKNDGAEPSSSVTAALQAGAGVTFPSGPQSYGVLASGVSVVRPFTFTAAGSTGDLIAATLQLQDPSNSLGSVSYPFLLGQPVTSVVANAGLITIPSKGTASPYPSTLAVSNLTCVTNVTCTLLNVSHTFPDDIDVLLVSPAGAKVALMSSAGGGSDLSNVTLTFSDAAATLLPNSTQITAGTYKPSSYSKSTVDMPAPAPAHPYGSAMSVFSGTNANGTWSLYVNDHSSGDSGAIAGGWRLTFSLVNLRFNMAVRSPFGAVSPPVGTNSYNPGVNIPCSVLDSPVVNGTTQYVCAGWSGSGSLTNGVGTNTVVTLTNDSQIAWLWLTNYFLAVLTNGSGSVDVTNAWHASGAGVTLLAAPGQYYHFAGWQGATNGGEIAGNRINLPMNDARSITAAFAADVTTNGTPDWWLAYHGQTNFVADDVKDADGDGMFTWQEWIAGTDPTNKLSLLSFTGIAGETGSMSVVQWFSVSNKVYSVETSADLLTGFFPEASGLTGAPPVNVYTDSVGGADRVFYRIRVGP